MERTHGRSLSAFTLVELMIGIAIVSVLAAIAVPMYARHQDNVRLLEPELTFDALWPLLLQAHSEGAFSTYPDESSAWSTTVMGGYDGGYPRGYAEVDKQPVQWNPSDPPAEKFAELGYEPNGMVRCGYVARGWMSGVALLASCDVNGDGVVLFPGSKKTDSDELFEVHCLDFGGGGSVTDEPMLPNHDYTDAQWDNELVQGATCR